MDEEKEALVSALRQILTLYESELNSFGRSAGWTDEAEAATLAARAVLFQVTGQES